MNDRHSNSTWASLLAAAARSQHCQCKTVESDAPSHIHQSFTECSCEAEPGTPPWTWYVPDQLAAGLHPSTSPLRPASFAIIDKNASNLCSMARSLPACSVCDMRWSVCSDLKDLAKSSHSPSHTREVEVTMQRPIMCTRNAVNIYRSGYRMPSAALTNHQSHHPEVTPSNPLHLSYPNPNPTPNPTQVPNQRFTPPSYWKPLTPYHP